MTSLRAPPAQRGPRHRAPGDADDRRCAAARPCSKAPSGFLYYVSIAGVTGTKTFAEGDVRAGDCAHQGASRASGRGGFRHHARREQAAAIARIADAAVVGSAIVDRIAEARRRRANPAQVSSRMR